MGEKILWLLLVALGNMVAMPIFYVFMVRRYLGIEGRTSPRDEATLDALLMKCDVERECLSADQLSVLRSYCRERRFLKWSVIPLVMLLVFMLYAAVVFIPRGTRMFVDLIPERVIVVDKASDSREELAPDPEQQRTLVLTVLMFGAMVGMFGAYGFIIFVVVISELCGNRDRKTLIRFLKVTGDRGSSRQ